MMKTLSSSTFFEVPPSASHTRQHPRLPNLRNKKQTLGNGLVLAASLLAAALICGCSKPTEPGKTATPSKAASAPAAKVTAAATEETVLPTAEEVEAVLESAREKIEAPPHPSRGKALDEMIARFSLYDVFPSSPVPGYPGADPSKGRNPWERYPEFQNYPGSVEHFRCDNQRYIPPLNPFNMKSLIRNFKAVDLPGVDPRFKEEFGEPVVYVVRHAPTVLTGEKRAPVPVVRLNPGGQRLKFKVSPLPLGLYVVRVIACLNEKDVRNTMPEDLILEMKINDGPNGEINTYALRQHGTYNFYSMGEFFFRVETEKPRAFEIDIGSHPESKVDLLVHNVDVHDRLSTCAKRAGKKESNAVRPEVLKAQWQSPEGQQVQKDCTARLDSELAEFGKKNPGLSTEELTKKWRQERDDMIWQQLPPLNATINTVSSGHYAVPSEMDPATEAKLKTQGLVFSKNWESWEGQKPPDGFATWFSNYNPYGFNPFRMEFLDSKQTDKNPVHTYTWDDLKALKPLPGLPFEVYPWGKRFADDKGSYFFFPQVAGIYSSLASSEIRIKEPPRWGTYLKGGDLTVAHDYALYLVHMAYDAPTFSVLHKMNVVLGDQARNMGRRYAHEDRGIHYNFLEWSSMAGSYDQLFPFIQNSQELADSVGRYIPWVKKPEDVIRLLDTYLLQFGAQEAMCFQKYYDHEHAAMLANLAAVQADPTISDPWMESMFNWTWEYPARIGPFRSFLYESMQRDGSTAIGSFFYAQSGGLAAKVQEAIDSANGRISDKYTLKNIPRVTATPHWFVEARVAGMHHPGIGDVGGPCVTHGQWMENIQHWMKTGWQWTKEPRFARGVVLFGNRKFETDAEWAEITKAAEGIRHPYMANRSRVLSNWGGILEGGTQSDDFRFRHAARVRIGTGIGHVHSDALDLGLWSLGLSIAPDGGARGGYGRPDVQQSWMHNVVTLDKANRGGHAWCTDLTDMDGCQYLSARGSSNPIFARQVALIEVDTGKPSAQPPSDPSFKMGTTYGNDITLPKAYFVDFFRAKGGSSNHAYNFHGPSDDEFNASVKPRALDAFETDWLDSQTAEKKNYVLANEQWGGTIEADVLTATWRMGREPRKFKTPDRGERTTRAPERDILGSAYDPNSPRKYLRMHLPGQKGASFLTGAWIAAASAEDRTDGEYLRQTHVIRKGQESLFAAVFEPYAGTPFIQGVSLEGDPSKSDNPVALHVTLAGGQQDLCFGDLAGAPVRTLKDGTQVQARFAYVSRDALGLRQASLVGSKKLETKELAIIPKTDEWSAKVAQVDYDRQTLLLDGAFPGKVMDGTFFEVGFPAEGTYPERWTNFEAVKVEPKDGKTMLQWRKGADIGLGTVNSFAKNDKRSDNAWNTQIEENLDLETGASRFYAANEKGDLQWKCDFDNGTCVLYGRESKQDDLKPGEHIYFYEFGVGTIFRAPTKVSIKRQAPGVYALTANVPCEIKFKVGQVETSSDGKQWKPATNPLNIQPDQLPNGGLQIRWK